MKQFDYDKIMQPNTVVHCRTEEQANELLTWADSKGLKWSSGSSYLINDCWFMERERTCYDLYNGLRSDLKWSETHENNNILSFEDAILKPKKNIYGFIGYSGSGKDYESKRIVKDYQRINMSDAVKEIVYCQLKTNEKQIDYEDLKNETFWLHNTYFTGRDLMNGLTESIIEYDSEFWFKIWKNKVLNSDAENIVVTDIRYLPSLKYLFDSKFNTKLFFTNYKSNRYKRQEGKTEELIDRIIKENENISHMDDITEYIRKIANE